MSDTYEILSVDEGGAWDAFVARARGGTVFSTSIWLEGAAEVFGGRARRWGCYKNGRLLAALSGLEQRRWGLKGLHTPQLTPHGGLLFGPPPGKGPARLEAEWHRAAEVLIAHMEHRYDHLWITHAPGIADMRPFAWAGWETRLRYTYRMDLRDPGALWERLEGRTRTLVRKAEKAGFEVRPTTDMELVQRQYELIFAQRKDSPPIASESVRRFAALAAEAGLARAFCAHSPAGAVAASVVFVKGFDTAYAWIPGADPAFNSTGALSLLYWRFFEQCENSRFDFVGANIPSIAKFKRGFGGDLVPYFAVEGCGSPLARTLIKTRRAARGILGNLRADSHRERR